MWGAVLRGVAVYVLGILLWTPLDMVIGIFLDTIKPKLGASSPIVWSLEASVEQWPLVLLAVVAVFVLARASVESTVGRGV